MDSKITKFLIIAILISFFSLVLIRQKFNSKNENKLRAGDRIEITDLKDINGINIKLDGLILFVFFSPDCQLCIDEVLVWNYLNEKYRGIIKVIGVSKANYNKLKRFSVEFGVNYHIVSDAKLYEYFSIDRIPSSVLVDSFKVVNFQFGKSASIRVKEIEDYVKRSREIF